MSKLELKIPPPLLMFLFLALMWIISFLPPAFSLPDILKYILFGTISGMGVTFGLSGLISLRKAKTTANPIKLDDSSSLLTSGIYKISRNPMYVGILFILIGWGIISI